MAESVAVIGLGKLGAGMVAAFASRGLDVIGVDVNEEPVRLLNQGRAPVQETDLAVCIADNRERIRATSSHRDAILGSTSSFVIVPTPSDASGAFSLEYAASAFREIGRALAETVSYHTVVLTSTVLPGATRYALLPILERESGKRAGEDFGLCYSPEFVALGSVIRDLLHPDFTLVGELDAKAGAIVEEIYSRVTVNDAPCKRMSLENAELAKLAVNTFITTKISFANMLGELCEQIPGGDVDRVTDALGADARIGRKYLTGAIGYGGPCFPRDNIAMTYLAKLLESQATLAEATEDFNRGLLSSTLGKLRPGVGQGTPVAVLGLAYKTKTHVVERSQGVALAKALSEAGARVTAYDPLARHTARAELEGYASLSTSAGECLEGAEVVLITTPEDEFRRLRASDFHRGSKKTTVMDFWRILPKEVRESPSINYVATGRSMNEPANVERMKALWSRQAGGIPGTR
jgi:UDPglucose 6-dehydrogenase